VVKRVTGGDELTAAAKYEAEITFRATWTLVLAANDAPAIRDDDDGVWNRVMRIPFLHVVPAEQRNPEVRARLSDPSDAGPAVLAWAVRGCLDWQTNKLGSAPAVERSTAHYRDEMDRAGDFFADCLVFDQDDECRVSREALRETYERWCRENGVKRPLSAREMAERLRRNGAEDGRTNGVRIWKCVRLRGPNEGERESGTPGTPRDITSRKSSQEALAGDFTKLVSPSDPGVPHGVSYDPDTDERQEW
jgi:putative DNA primase/helicase